MRKVFLFFILLGVVPLNLAAQDDDVYFIPKKKCCNGKLQQPRYEKPADLLCRQQPRC